MKRDRDSKAVLDTEEDVEEERTMVEDVVEGDSVSQSVEIDAESEDEPEESDADVSDEEDSESDDSVYDSEDYIPEGQDAIEEELQDEQDPFPDNASQQSHSDEEINSKFINLAELSDSSEEEESPLVRVGNVPREWYDDLDHLGYNIEGVPIGKQPKTMDAIDSFLAMRENGEYRRTVYDELHDRNVVLSPKDIEMIQRLRHGTYAHSEFNPEDTPYNKAPQQKHPISGNFYNPPKRSFVPSKYENQKVLYFIKALRNGWIRPKEQRDKEEEEANEQLLHDIWNGNDSLIDKANGPPFIPAPKLKTPGHAESYNPPVEYLPDEEELQKWEDMDPSDRPHNFTPKQYAALRKVPAFPNFIKERFERCLDLYLCPRAMRKRLQIDPESLIPKLPNPSSLKPYPTFSSITFAEHSHRVQSLAACGEFLASGDDSGLVCIWEIETGRCLSKHLFALPSDSDSSNVNEEESKPILQLDWNPKFQSVLGVAVGNKLVLWDVFEEGFGFGFRVKNSSSTGVRISSASAEKDDQGHILASVELLDGPIAGFHWHRSGDFVSTFRSSESSKSAVMVHKLSSGDSQQPFSKSKGLVQDICFHPSRPLFFVATKAHVRIYDLAKQALVKKLKSPMKWISSIDIHQQSGDHLIVGSYDRRVCWFDLDLSSSPFKTMKYHKAAVRSVRFHPSFPLFLSASDDGTVHVFHGRVYNDLLTDPQIVPLKVLKAHKPDSDGLGALNSIWHPTQPWLFTSGSDGKVKLFC